jgi:hypothetical protein
VAPVNQERFDDLAKGLATNRLSRRQVIKGLFAGALLATPLSTLLNRAALAQTGDCSIHTYSTAGTNFTGDPIRADAQFFDSLDSINGCAGENNVTVRITSSYRRPGDPVGNTVVPPAQRSNHHAGHAIDMNVRYTDNTGAARLCDSRCLGRATLPTPVEGFIDCVRAQRLRWGGMFRTPDPVHIDDNLNADFTAWKRRVNAAWCPDGSTCVNGRCCRTARVCEQGTVCCFAGQVCSQGACVDSCNDGCPECHVCNSNTNTCEDTCGPGWKCCPGGHCCEECEDCGPNGTCNFHCRCQEDTHCVANNGEVFCCAPGKVCCPGSRFGTSCCCTPGEDFCRGDGACCWIIDPGTCCGGE